MDKKLREYTAEQVRACILAYKNGDLNYCRSGIVDLLTKYASVLDAAPSSGESCVHDWRDARNKYVSSGEFCTKCRAIRGGNEPSPGESA